MTYRERREARAEKRRSWAGSRSAAADAAHERAHEIGGMIPMGQPILVGHHSEGRHRRDIGRIDSAMRASVDNSRMASRHEQAASEIERQLASSIYDDDPDAIEQLTAKLTGLEAERDRIKAYNASCRSKTGADVTLLDGKQRANLASVAKVCSYQIGAKGQYPAYALTNLSGTIKRTRDRIARLERDKVTGPRYRTIVARFASSCDRCSSSIEKGDTIGYCRTADERVICAGCNTPDTKEG